MNQTEIQTRISQVRKNLDNNEATLEYKRTERAKLAIQNSTGNAATIKRMDKEIDSLRKDVENAPIELRLLEENLTAAQRAAAEKAKQALISQQKSCAGQIEAISKKLVASLEVSNDLNIQLDTVTRRYCALKEQTGHEIPMRTTCWPSEQMLKVITETLSAELQGQTPQRIAGQPPFVRI